MKRSKMCRIESLINTVLNTLIITLKRSSNVTTIRTSVGVFSSILVVFYLSQAHAQQANLGTHAHGVSGLNIVIEGNKTEIQLRTQAINIDDVQHAASTKKQINKAKQSEAKSHAQNALFSFSSVYCRLTQMHTVLANLIHISTI